jgi:hypothetical protein
LGEELVVGALFDDLAGLDNADAVGVADGAEAVGDAALNYQAKTATGTERGWAKD